MHSYSRGLFYKNKLKKNILKVIFFFFFYPVTSYFMLHRVKQSARLNQVQCEIYFCGILITGERTGDALNDERFP